MSSPKQAVKDILDALPTLLAVAVVETETGMALASHSNIADFDIDTAAAYNTAAGGILIVGGLGVTVVAYRLMIAIGRIPEERRWFR